MCVKCVLRKKKYKKKPLYKFDHYKPLYKICILQCVRYVEITEKQKTILMHIQGDN